MRFVKPEPQQKRHPRLTARAPFVSRIEIQEKTFRGIKLLDLNLSASLFQLLLDVLSLSLGSLLLDSLGSAVNDSLSLLQAQTGDLLDQLDDAHLASASLDQDDVELGLLFLSGSSSASSGGSSSSNSRNAELFAVCVDELLQLQNGQLLDGVDDGSNLLRSNGNNPPI